MHNIFCFLLISLFSAQLTNQQECPSAYFNKGLELNYIAYRNRSCHYITEWTVKNQAPKLADNLKIDVKSSTSESGGLQTFQIKGIIAVPPSTPQGYEYFPGVGYYKFYPAGVNTFYEAMSICEKDGGHLAILNSVAESEVLKLIFSRFPKAKEWAYLGFNEIEHHGEFVTIFGEPLHKTGFMKWSPGKPDNYNGNEHCGSMNRIGYLDDIPCDANGPWPFFCEFDLTWGIN